MNDLCVFIIRKKRDWKFNKKKTNLKRTALFSINFLDCVMLCFTLGFDFQIVQTFIMQF